MTTRSRGGSAAILPVALSVAALLSACGGTASPNSSARAAQTVHTVTDMTPTRVTVPVHVTGIGEAFPAHVITDIMLGAAAKITAVPPNVKEVPLLAAVDPGINRVPELFSNDGSASVEELLKAKTDVVYQFGGGSSLQPFRAAGMAGLNVGFTSWAQLGQSVLLAGEVDGPTELARAKAYVRYLDANVKLVTSRVAKLPASQRPSVLHIASYPPIVVDGTSGDSTFWETSAGGTDVTRGVDGSHVTITSEQLLRWNPDVIIVETPGGDQGLAPNTGESVVAALSKIPGWKNLKAVIHHRVYIDPQGLYPWERASPEEALQILWAAKILHPALFRDINMQQEARSFYRKFFDYNLSAAQLKRMFE